MVKDVFVCMPGLCFPWEEMSSLHTEEKNTQEQEKNCKILQRKPQGG